MAGEKVLTEKEVVPTVEVGQFSATSERVIASGVERPSAGIEASVNKEGKAGMEQANIQAVPQKTVESVLSISKQQQEVEKVLSSGLEEIYTSLSAEQKQEFRVVGENTAKQISELLSQSKIKVDKIINLIKSWLKLLPGVNKFFLEQEAKIKTDALLQLKRGGEQ